jgi:hypothetical protein
VGHLRVIDTSFDFRTDSNGKDPDIHSKTLKKYQQFLWSKSLPNGRHFLLESNPSRYLIFKSNDKNFHLTSDAITNSYKWTKNMASIRQLVSTEKIKKVFEINCTVGSFIVFLAIELI